MIHQLISKQPICSQWERKQCVEYGTFRVILFFVFLNLHAFCVTGAELSYFQSDTTTSSVHSIKPGVFKRLGKSTKTLERNMQRTYQRTMRSVERKELRFRQAIQSVDSSLTNRLFDQGNATVTNDLRSATHSKQERYIDLSLDSLLTSLQFLEGLPEITGHRELMNALSSQRLLSRRLKQQLDSGAGLKLRLELKTQQLLEEVYPAGATKPLRAIRKEVATYQQQWQNFQLRIEDSRQWSNRLISVARKSPGFQRFFREHSVLAELFPSGAGPDSADSTSSGLQSRQTIKNLMEEHLGRQQRSPYDRLLQQVPMVQQQLHSMDESMPLLHAQNKLNQRERTIPVNRQKGKSFGQRLEWNVNVQHTKARLSLPVLSDIAASVGYRLDDKRVIGVGLAYRVGLGYGWRSLRLSHEGVGFRSYIDWKLKGSVWLTGGYEQNYFASLTRENTALNAPAWQGSPLLGVSRLIRIDRGPVKKARVQLLWDVGRGTQRPERPFFLFRVHYLVN